jgi:hypothetical protein
VARHLPTGAVAEPSPADVWLIGFDTDEPIPFVRHFLEIGIDLTSKSARLPTLKHNHPPPFLPKSILPPER